MAISRIQALLGENQVNFKPQVPRQLPSPVKALPGNKITGDSTLLSGLKTSKATLPNLSFTEDSGMITPGMMLNRLLKPSSLSTVSMASGTASLNLPARPANALTGSQFIAGTIGMDRMKREQLILNEISSGNVPDFVRQMKEITVSGAGKDGKMHTAVIKVMPDYLAIGSNEDFIRIPMNPLTAQKIADRTGTVLPTSKIVDEVYKQASVKLTPQPMQAGSKMMSSEYYRTHQAKVESQRQEKGGLQGQLTAGHKKDVILSNMLDKAPNRVAIYGWHQPNGKPIQGTSTIHEDTYADYSHGVRLINAKITVDGVERNIADIMKDPNLSFLVSKEGPIKTTRIKI